MMSRLSEKIKFTVKPVTQPAGYTRFHGLEGRVKLEGGLYSRAGNSSKIV